MSNRKERRCIVPESKIQTDIITRSPMSIGPHHMTTDMYETGADGYVLRIDVRVHVGLRSYLKAGRGLHIFIGFDSRYVQEVV